jgi:hypothetical protein
MNPGIPVFGVEPRGAPSMRLSLDGAGRRRMEPHRRRLAAPMAGQVNSRSSVATWTTSLIDDDVIAGAVRGSRQLKLLANRGRRRERLY